MNTTTKTDVLIASLTIEQARQYAAQTDQLVWVETTLLDPNDISRRMAGCVEDALEALLAAAIANPAAKV